MKKIAHFIPSAVWVVAAYPSVMLAADKSDSDRPNIIFILCDDMGYGDFVTDRNISKLPIWIVWLPRVCFLRKLMQGVLSVRPHVPH